MSDSPEVLAFRVGELEKNVTGLRNDLKELGGTLGGGMTALQTQLSNYQTTMGDRYVTRRDWEARNAEVEAHFRQMVTNDDQTATRAWLVVSSLGTVAAALVAFFGWFRPMH